MDWNDINATKKRKSFGKPAEKPGFESTSLGDKTLKGIEDAAATPEPQEAPQQSAMDQLLNSYKESLQADEEASRKRNGRAVVNSIADMGRAIANMYYTTQYTPNAYDGGVTLEGKAQERYERAKAERDKNRDALMKYALALKEKEDDNWLRGYKERSLQQQREYNNTLLAMREAEAKRKEAADAAEAQRKAEQDKKKNEIDQQNLEIKRESNNIRRQQIYARTNGGSGGKKSDYEEIILEDGTLLRVPKTRFGKVSTKYNIESIYRYIPEDKRPKPQYTSSGTKRPVSLDQKLQAIVQNMDNPDVAAKVKELGIEIGSGQPAAKPAGGKQKKKDNRIKVDF